MFIYATKGTACNLLRSPKKRLSKSTFIFFLLIFLLINASLHAQFYEYGQDAGSIRWNHFSSEHYQLIYPRGLDSVAMQLADKFEYFYPHQAKVLDHAHGKMPVIVHNEASFSNGVFVWAPKRVEIFTNPDPNSYPQDWLTQLAIHEGRHAFQVSKLDQGISKGLSFIGGEQAVGAITGFLPAWYLEGDAVDAETRFSNTGRGRMPSFEMGMKALLLENKRYSYSKAIFGSYKDHVPNHYELGYLMVRHGRRKYGDKFWTDFEDYASRKPYLIAPTYFSMKKYGVKSKSTYYKAALAEYKSHWLQTRENRKISPQNTLNRVRNRGFTSYRFPHWVSDTSLLVLKSGLDQIPEFVLVDINGKEKRLFRPGFLNTGSFSAGKNFLVWDEWVPDTRWSNRSYSVIKRMNYHTGEVIAFGKRSRYYAPSLSSDETMITAIEQQTDYSFHLQIFSIDGELITSIRSPENHFIQHPVWIQDSTILVTLNKLDGEYLYRYSLRNKNWEKVFHSGFNDISNPFVHGSEVYFSGTYSGIDNIYCLDMATDSLFMVTSAEFGAFEPAVSESGEMLTYGDYQAHGYNLAVAEIQKKSWVAIDDLPKRDEQLDMRSSEDEQKIIDGEKNMAHGTYDPSPYNKTLHALNIHSWLPLYFNYLNPGVHFSVEEIPVSPGLTLVSQNLLSTVVGMLGYEYKDKHHYLHTGATLKGKTPVFEFRMDYGGYPDVYKFEDQEAPSTRADRLLFTSSMYIPVRFNTGKYITFMQPRLGWSYSTDYFFNPEAGNYQAGSHRFSYQCYFTSYLRKSRKDILPRLGVSASLNYKHAPFDEYNLGSIYSYTVSMYLPGILKHQTLKIKYGRQVQNPIRYLFGNSISLVRGMPELSGLDMNIFGADYTFPLLYPDLSLEPLIYIKRIRANLWGDYLVGYDMLTGDSDNPIEDQVHYTLGFDLLADFHPLRFHFPVSMGARCAFLPKSQEWKVELLFNIDI